MSYVGWGAVWEFHMLRGSFKCSRSIVSDTRERQMQDCNSWHVEASGLLQTTDGDARHLNKRCCLPQSLRVTNELVPPFGHVSRLTTSWSGQSWTDGGARHLNKRCCLPQSLRVTKELVPPFGHVSRLTTSWSGQSWSRCRLVIGAVSQGQQSVSPILSLLYFMSIYPAVSCSQSS